MNVLIASQNGAIRCAGDTKGNGATPLDHMPLAAYCVAYAHWRQAEEALAEWRSTTRRPTGC
jgi:hypothetical protein